MNSACTVCNSIFTIQRMHMSIKNFLYHVRTYVFPIVLVKWFGLYWPDSSALTDAMMKISFEWYIIWPHCFFTIKIWPHCYIEKPVRSDFYSKKFLLSKSDRTAILKNQCGQILIVKNQCGQILIVKKQGSQILIEGASINVFGHRASIKS